MNINVISIFYSLSSIGFRCCLLISNITTNTQVTELTGILAMGSQSYCCQAIRIQEEEHLKPFRFTFTMAVVVVHIQQVGIQIDFIIVALPLLATGNTIIITESKAIDTPKVSSLVVIAITLIPMDYQEQLKHSQLGGFQVKSG